MPISENIKVLAKKFYCELVCRLYHDDPTFDEKMAIFDCLSSVLKYLSVREDCYIFEKLCEKMKEGK